MQVTFLGQGFESTSINAVGNYLIKYFKQTDFHSFIGMSAFASEAGIFGLANHIVSASQHFRNLTLIVGVDQDGTSKEALEEILHLNINSYVFYQKESSIFHPKIYLFEGERFTKLIVGSSNLTARGLFVNVESSLLVEFETNDKEGVRLLAELKTYYKSLFDLSDPNLFKITNELIEDFMVKGIVHDETFRKQIYNGKTVELDKQQVKGIEDILIPKRSISKIPFIFSNKSGKKRVGKSISEEDQSSDSESLISITDSILLIPQIKETLIWKSGRLTERDLNIPKGEKTNATGSMLFKKGETEGIDQRHYFRDVVFASLPWVFDTNAKAIHLERTTAFFQIIIEGTNHGIFPLILTHNTRTDTETYRQKNSMTSVSWGKAKSLIAQESLIGKSVSLYKSEDDSSNQYTFVFN